VTLRKRSIVSWDDAFHNRVRTAYDDRSQCQGHVKIRTVKSHCESCCVDVGVSSVEVNELRAQPMYP